MEALNHWVDREQSLLQVKKKVWLSFFWIPSGLSYILHYWTYFIQPECLQSDIYYVLKTGWPEEREEANS